MNDYTKPIYAVDRREFKTVSGLCNYLTKKHEANSISGIGMNRTLSVYRDRIAVAIYLVSAPIIGSPMTLTLGAQS